MTVSCNQNQFYEKEFLDAAGKKDILDPTLGDGGGGNPVDPTDPGVDPTPTPNPTPTPGPGLCNGTGYEQTNDRFTQNLAREGKVDIVWVMDNSGSMAEEQEALARNFDAFIGEFIAKKTDFRMVIITTDGTSAKNGKIIGQSDVLLTSAMAQANETKFMADFKRIINVGTNGSGDEKGLGTAEAFLKNYSAGWMRPDAFLVMVVVSDEQDVSSKTVAQYTDFYKAQKANAGMVKMYSIVTTRPVNNWETVGQRYIDVTTNLGGTVSDIHQDFYLTLRDMGGKILDLIDSFPLSKVPANAQFKVLVDGVEATNGWTYDEGSRSIKFDSGFVPDEGSIVIVYYNVSCTN